jgi:carbon-monoxide dehydrogenase large subunit
MGRQSRNLPSQPRADVNSDRSVSIGHPIARLEDDRLLRGGSRYISDLIATSNALRVKVMRSSHPHARLLAVDATTARRLSGVVAVITTDDLADIGDLPCDWVAPGM